MVRVCAPFEPGRITIQTESGRLVDSRDDPRSFFRGQTPDTPWDDMHVAYFGSYALWNYLTIPFLCTYPGFVTEELAPWEENGEQWRPLKVIVPDSIASHSREQVVYFGPDGLLRRHDYTVDVMGGAPGSNYAADYCNVGGIVVPTKRRVYAPDANKRKIPEPVLVAIDIRDISFGMGSDNSHVTQGVNYADRNDRPRKDGGQHGAAYVKRKAPMCSVQQVAKPE